MLFYFSVMQGAAILNFPTNLFQFTTQNPAIAIFDNNIVGSNKVACLRLFFFYFRRCPQLLQ